MGAFRSNHLHPIVRGASSELVRSKACGDFGITLRVDIVRAAD